jgi:CheY-like chemotaxis protein
VPALAGLNVLIVDDEVLVKMLIADILDELGCRVADTASTLEEALAKAENGAFDAAILDVNLSGRAQNPFLVLDRLWQAAERGIRSRSRPQKALQDC